MTNADKQAQGGEEAVENMARMLWNNGLFSHEPIRPICEMSEQYKRCQNMARFVLSSITSAVEVERERCHSLAILSQVNGVCGKDQVWSKACAKVAKAILDGQGEA